MVLDRKIERLCPHCDEGEIFVVESVPGRRWGYWCEKCGANFHALKVFNVLRGQYEWIGRLLNPDYWELNNNTIDEGLIALQKREAAGISPYLDEWVLETVKEENNQSEDGQ